MDGDQREHSARRSAREDEGERVERERGSEGERDGVWEAERRWSAVEEGERRGEREVVRRVEEGEGEVRGSE